MSNSLAKPVFSRSPSFRIGLHRIARVLKCDSNYIWRFMPFDFSDGSSRVEIFKQRCTLNEKEWR